MNGTTKCVTICGDGFKAGLEECDDGLTDRFGCDEDCKGKLIGFECEGGNYQDPSKCKEICGDGLVVGNEDCDDGTDDTKGCKDNCVGG